METAYIQYTYEGREQQKVGFGSQEMCLFIISAESSFVYKAKTSFKPCLPLPLVRLWSNNQCLYIAQCDMFPFFQGYKLLVKSPDGPQKLTLENVQGHFAILVGQLIVFTLSPAK